MGWLVFFFSFFMCVCSFMWILVTCDAHYTKCRGNCSRWLLCRDSYNSSEGQKNNGTLINQTYHPTYILELDTRTFRLTTQNNSITNNFMQYINTGHPNWDNNIY